MDVFYGSIEYANRASTLFLSFSQDPVAGALPPDEPHPGLQPARFDRERPIAGGRQRVSKPAERQGRLVTLDGNKNEASL